MTMFPCGKIDGRMSSTVIVHDSRIDPVYADMRIAAYPCRRHIIRWCNIEFTRVDSPVDFVRQHVIDPELCSRCGACADAVRHHAHAL